jgi:hypothetical protein
VAGTANGLGTDVVGPDGFAIRYDAPWSDFLGAGGDNA